MTIGIDIRMLANKRKSGIEEYTENLLSHMLFIDTSIKFKLFYSSFRDHIGDYSWLNLPNVDLVDYKIPNNLLFGSARVFNWPFMDELMDGADVFFSPHFFLAPLSKGCKRVTTIHDLSFASFPEYFSARQNIWHRIEMSPSKQFKSSDKIIAVSKSTKDDLASKYDIDPARINVVHSGISDNIARPTDENLEKFRLNKGLPEKFILFLGKLEPRKNVVALIRAFNMLKLQTGFEDLNLVIAGTRGQEFLL
ncbi:MAG: Glycosyl transferase group 1 [Candidatus Yanofskybacteria bacterium GW2011_GWF1_44_227]|nr:MAG: Glycosyl transferase group 1 [Candidatus Yanofskybacteria bacterium GW2011_GWF1_44_227]